jgi:two-component system NtrC family sensor kinase
MEAFVWSDRYATGIDSIDEQHHKLFDLVNEIGDLMIGNDVLDDVHLQALFKRLGAYAQFHFADEERVMREAGLGLPHIDLHHQHHQDFIAQLMEMWKQRGQMASPAETLHRFLAAWLGFHILGEDQGMAREIIRIREGMSAVEAHELESTRGERATSALLQALQNLYGVVTQQNHNLERANAELESRVAERTAQLVQAEKMASIGQLAAGVAHEINNPIGFVTSNLGTLRQYLDDLLRIADAASGDPAAQAAAAEVDLPFLREDMLALVKETGDGLSRVRTIVANLKDFSHVDEADWQQADLLHGLESTIGVLTHQLKDKVELQRELQPLPPVYCIAVQINQVFVNILLNAVQAITDHGTITLRSGQVGEEVWIDIADSGVGMNEETRRRIFDPFFTTKPVGTGTGLGMSVVYEIIRSHGGRLDVSSELGKGSCVRIWLPVAGPT